MTRKPPHPNAPRGPRPTRRGLLGAALGAGAGLALPRAVGGVVGVGAPAAAEAAGATTPPAAALGLTTRIPFVGERQAGVVTPRPPHAAVMAFDVVAADRPGAAEALRALSARAHALTAGYPALFGNPGEGPTPDSGILGARVQPDALTVTIGLGASLFDDRFGLRRARPDGLVAMPTFPDDQLVAEQCHGDVVVQLCAGTSETVLHALRDLMRATRGALAPRWKVEGFLPQTREPGASRNLLGFKDGTGNPDAADRALMDALVWTPTGATFLVVRTIRNRVEFWDRVALDEQELMIGRRKDTGAPLDGAREGDAPDYTKDPKGDVIPLDAHIRLARPRTTKTEPQRILRRPYNYSRGLDDAGQLDMGLLFISYQRDLEHFAEIQRRLAGEPLIDYVVPTGGGYFHVPPGARDAQDWVGSALFT